MVISKTQIATGIIVVAAGSFLGGGALLYVQRHQSFGEQNRIERQESTFSLEDAYKKPPSSFRDSPSSKLYGRVPADHGDETVLAAISPQALDAELADNQTLNEDIRRARQEYQEAVDSAVAATGTYRSMLPNYGQNRYRDAANLQEVKVKTMEKEQPKFEAALKQAERGFLAARA